MKKSILRKLLAAHDPHADAPKWVKQIRARGMDVDLGAWLPKK